MNKILNIGNKKSSIELIQIIKEKNYSSFDIKITNCHITELNKVIGKKVFKNDVLYINARTLWEIMQPIGGKGKHHYHNLSPEEIYDILMQAKNSKEIFASHDGRYLVITLSSLINQSKYALILEPNGHSKNSYIASVIRVITMYPYNKK